MAKPKTLNIIGKERGLDEVIEGKTIIREDIEQNRYNYRKVWKSWLPPANGKEPEDGIRRISYLPIPSKRLCRDLEFEGNIRDAPYWIFILNQARERRPKSNQSRSKKKEKAHCKLCENVLGNNMILDEIDEFYLCPNEYPYDMLSSLLIYKGKDKKQGELEPRDIETAMKTSILLDQIVFYNSPGAGASILEHGHWQLVDPSEMIIEGEEHVPYPIFNRSLVGKEPVKRKPDIFRITRYPIDAVIFMGGTAPANAYNLIERLKADGRGFNILVNKNMVYVFGRNKENEVSICMERRVGTMELSGVYLMGDVEERSGGYKIKKHGAALFTEMDYYMAGKNAKRATMRLDAFVNDI